MKSVVPLPITQGLLLIKGQNIINTPSATCTAHFIGPDFAALIELVRVSRRPKTLGYIVLIRSSFYLFKIFSPPCASRDSKKKQ